MPLYREKWSGSQSTDFIVSLATLCVPFYYLLYFHVEKLSFPLNTTSLPSFGEFCFGDIETGLLKFTKYWCQYWQKKNGLDGYKFLLDSSQESPTLHDPMDCTLPGSSVHGISQTRILEWVGMPFSRGSSPPRDGIHVSLCFLHWQVSSLPLTPPGKAHFSMLPDSKSQFVLLGFGHSK